MNIFDSIVENPIALGAITGVLEMADAGLTAKKKEAIAKEKDRIENEKSFIEYLRGDPEAARIFMNQPSSYGMMSNLAKTNIHGFNSILISASKAPKLSEVDKKIMDQMSGNSTFAKNYLLANPKLAKENAPLYKFAVVSGVSNSMSSIQSQTYNDLIKGGLDNVKQYMSTVFPAKVVENDQGEIEERYSPQILNNALFHSLNAFIVSKSNEVPTVELSDTNINTLKAQLKEAPPSQVPSILAKFKKDTGELDFKSNAFVNMAGLIYGSKDGDAFKAKITSLAEAFEKIDGTVGEANQNKVLREEVKLVMENLKPNEKAKYLELANSPDPEDQKAFQSYKYIEGLYRNMSMMGGSDKVKKYQFGNTDLSYITGKKDPAQDFQAGMNYIISVNEMIKSGRLEPDTLGDEGRSKFIGNLKSVLTNIDVNATQRKSVGPGITGKTEKGLPINFSNLVPEIAQIPEIAEHIEKVLGLAGEGQDTEYKMPPQVINNVELGENKLKLADGLIYQLSPETISFANSKQMSPVELFKDKGYRKLITGSDGIVSRGVKLGSDGVFKKINMLRQSGIVVGDTDITPDNARKLARFFVVNNIDDVGLQYDIIAALKSDDLPQAWVSKQPYKLGLSPGAIAAGSKQLAGNEYDVKKLPQIIESTNAFVTELGAIKDYMRVRPGESSQFAADLYQLALNTVFLRGSLLDVVNDNIGNLINADTVVGETIEEREAEVQLLDRTFTEIMRSDFAENNALINSTFISLAYNYARTKDPNGRISDADFQSAYKALRAGYLDTETISIALLDEFEKDALAKQALNNAVNEHFSRYDNNTNTLYIQKDNVRGLRAIKDFKKVSSYTRQIREIKKYATLFQSGANLFGQNSRYAKKKTMLRGLRGERLRGVYEVFLFSPNRERLTPLAGSIPLYVDQSGKPLTLLQINEARASQ